MVGTGSVGAVGDPSVAVSAVGVYIYAQVGILSFYPWMLFSCSKSLRYVKSLPLSVLEQWALLVLEQWALLVLEQRALLLVLGVGALACSGSVFFSL